MNTVVTQPSDLRIRRSAKPRWIIALAMLLVPPMRALAETSPPDFSGFWEHGIAGIEYIPPAGSPMPVMDLARRGGCPPAGDNDPNPKKKTPLCGARVAGIPFLGDTDNAILKPATKLAIEQANARWRAGEDVYTPSARCMPSGVPRILQVQAPVEILQSPATIVMMYQRDHQFRTIHLNAAHLTGREPSWYGDSIGHYEGDTLVIDTVGQTSASQLDYYSTPHSTSLHVVERYRVINQGRTLEVRFTVEDPETFTAPWSAQALYHRSPADTQWEEEICAENNKNVPTPEASASDF